MTFRAYTYVIFIIIIINYQINKIYIKFTYNKTYIKIVMFVDFVIKN